MPEGRSFVWVPGWASSPGVWQGQISRLPDRRHLTVDFSSCRRPQDFPAAVVTVIGRAGTDPVVVGWSLGAMAALEAVAGGGAPVSRLLLVGCTGQFTASQASMGWPQAALEAMKRRLLRNPERVLEAFYNRMFSPGEIEKGVVEAWREIGPGDWSTKGLTAGLEYLAGYRAFDSSPPGVAVHLLHGDQDEICPLAAAEKLRRWAAARLTVFEKAGHCPLMTRPGDVHRWLSEAACPR